MTPPVRVSVPGEDLRAADRADLERVAERRILDRQRPGCARDDDAGDDAHAADRDRLGAGVPQLVEHLLDAVAADRARSP